MDPQRIARWFGILFLITFITSIPAFFIFYGPVLNETDYVLGAGSDGQVKFGALLEIILIVANIGTAVVIYPIVRRQNEIAAIGYVTSRVMECAIIAVGIFSVLSGRDLAPRRRQLGGYCLARHRRQVAGRAARPGPSCSVPASLPAWGTGSCSVT